MELSPLTQLGLTHLLIMGAITYFVLDQPGANRKGEIACLVLGWLIPVVGPVLAGILILILRRRTGG